MGAGVLGFVVLILFVGQNSANLEAENPLN